MSTLSENLHDKMNRVYRFRAWDKILKRMHYWSLEEIWQSELMPDFKEYEITQWTGLYDRLGKEIYEGDIVKWMIFPENEDGSKFTVDVVECGEVTGIFATRKRHEIIGLMPPYRSIEVIGNIYETPELLR